MVEIESINFRRPLLSWLNELPKSTSAEQSRSRSIAIAIASRSAARVLPIIWDGTLERRRKANDDEIALRLLRAILISSVASIAPTLDIHDAAKAAALSAVHKDFAFGAGAAAADAVAAAYQTPAASFAATSVDSASQSSYTAEIWAEVRGDCRHFSLGADISNRPLWAENGAAPYDVWAKLKPNALERSEDWRFWVDWYDSLRVGKPMNLDLLTKVALIDPEIWDQGAAVVNPMIAQMRLDFVKTATFNGDRVEIHQDTNRLRAVPETTLPADHLADALDKLRDASAIFDDEDGANRMYEVLLPEQKIIADALDRYAARPMRLFDACRRVAGRVRAKVDAGDCPSNDALIKDYTEQLDQVAIDLRGFDDTIQKITTNRIIDGMKDLPQEQQDDFIAAADQVAEGAEGYMAEELPEIARLGVDTNLPPEERKTKLSRAVSYLLQAWSLGRARLGDGAKLVTDVGKVGGAAAAGVDGYLWMTGKLPIVLPWLISLF